MFTEVCEYCQWRKLEQRTTRPPLPSSSSNLPPPIYKTWMVITLRRKIDSSLDKNRTVIGRGEATISRKFFFPYFIFLFFPFPSLFSSKRLYSRTGARKNLGKLRFSRNLFLRDFAMSNRNPFLFLSSLLLFLFFPNLRSNSIQFSLFTCAYFRCNFVSFII